MALNNNDGILAVIWAAIGSACMALINKWTNSRKEKAEARKTNIEGRVLTAAEQRDQDKFTEEQLTKLEARFSKLQDENDLWQQENRKLTDRAKELLLKLEESQIEMKQARSEITILKMELIAYKSLKNK